MYNVGFSTNDAPIIPWPPICSNSHNVTLSLGIPLMNYEVTHLVVTINFEKEEIIDNKAYGVQKLYIDGKLFSKNGTDYIFPYEKQSWNFFVDNYLPDLDSFCIGRSSMNGGGCWYYSELSAYSLKFYSRALTDEEVVDSYRKSVSYHEFLEQQAKAKKENDGE